MLKIALDAMGGDHALGEIVRGGIEAARECQVEIVLVGREDDIERELDGLDGGPAGIVIANAAEVIEMGEQPVVAVRGKKDSSIVVGMGLLKEGKVSAFVSAGNTGAVVAASLLVLGKKKSIKRPALGTVFSFPSGPLLLLDAGANTDCKPDFLMQFAEMGNRYMDLAFDIENPRIGLLSVGEEQSKGNQLVREAHKRLRTTKLNFIGNVEGRDITNGIVDVIVTDGFTGNVLLKMGEGLGEMFLHTISHALNDGLNGMVPAEVLESTLHLAVRRFDYTEYGGAPLLGVNGTVIVAHGRSNSKTIKNAVAAAKKAVEQDLVGALGR
ncbi:phosphate acyltransferase PlsX [Chloroflexota bacterium]